MQAARRPFAEDDFGRKGEFADDLHPWDGRRPKAAIRKPQLPPGLQSFAQRVIRDASQPIF
jgi:hypothetical protein